MDGLAGASAVVTGASRGIGAAVVARLQAEGVWVAGLDLDPPESSPSPDIHVSCDLADAASVASAASRVLGLRDDIQILVNNAGIAGLGDACDIDEQQWARVMDINLRGAWLMSRALLPMMRARLAGAIVNVTSIHTRVTAAGVSPYAASKAGLVGLTRSLALENARHGIRVNAVSPGYVRTRLVAGALDDTPDAANKEAEMVSGHPLRRLGEPAEIAAAIAFLASSDASFITGAELCVDGGVGLSLIPL